MTEPPRALKDDMSTSVHVEEGQRAEIDAEKERALLRKIDFRLIPCVWFMYLLSYVSITDGALLDVFVTKLERLSCQ